MHMIAPVSEVMKSVNLNLQIKAYIWVIILNMVWQGEQGLWCKCLINDDWSNRTKIDKTWTVFITNDSDVDGSNYASTTIAITIHINSNRIQLKNKYIYTVNFIFTNTS